MNEIAIFGAGGFGREVACMILEMNKHVHKWNFIGFFDDNITSNTKINSLGYVIGGMDDINNWCTVLSLVICVGNPKIVYSIVGKINNPKINFPNVISDDFIIEDKKNFYLGRGNIIKGNCKVTTGVSIGNFNILNGSVTFGHDTKVQDYNIFMPGVKISGDVNVGNRNLFGTMSFVKQGIKIGDDIKLSPLSPLLSNPKDGNTYIGNPARIFKF